MSKILVTGPTGNLGNHVVSLLADMGRDARALVRDTGKASLPEGVDVARGDLLSPHTLVGALRDVDSVYLMWPRLAVEPRVVELIAEHARRVVYMSADVPDLADGEEPTIFHQEIERLMRQSGLTWTFVRAIDFATNTLGWADGAVPVGGESGSGRGLRLVLRDEARGTPGMETGVPPGERLRRGLDDRLIGIEGSEDPIEEVGRLGARLIIRQAMEDEVTQFLGRGRYERGGEPVAYRNGYEPITVKASSGAIELQRPRLRGAEGLSFESRIVGRGVARSHALETLVICSFLRGLSVRDVEAALAETFDGRVVSKSTVSRICEDTRERYRRWCRRRLDGPRPGLPVL